MKNLGTNKNFQAFDLSELPSMPGYILPKSTELIQQIRMAAVALRSGINVSIVGPSGSGKSMLAKYLNYICFEGRGMVALNAAAICDTLADSELFGYERGSFTGASQSKPSLFELADGGVVFLDEVTSMSMEVQAKLLRLVEEKRVKRVGSTQELPVNFSLITATNLAFKDAIALGQFREDLYYRISGFQIQMPSIHHDKSVCQQYAQAMIDRYVQEFGCEDAGYLSCLLTACLEREWPGNLREMENFIKMSICMHQQSVDFAMTFMQTFKVTIKESKSNTVFPGSFQNIELSFREKRLQIEQSDIELALRQYNYNVSKVAECLGMSRTTLYRKMKGLGIYG